MALWNEADEVAKELHHKREVEKSKQDAAAQAKEEMKKQQEHEKNKEQGMI